MKSYRGTRPLRLVSAVALTGSFAACGGHGAETTGVESGMLTPSFTLLVSTSDTRSAPVLLSGAALKGGPAYVFTSDATHSPNPAGIRQVDYWLDDPSMTTPPRHVEHFTPYDFIGTKADLTAKPWLTGTIAKGMHTITERVVPTSGPSETYSATFAIGATLVADAGVTMGTPETGAPETGKDAGTESGAPTGCPASSVSLLSFGSAGTGGDDTAVFQKAIDSTAGAGKTLRVPAGSASYNIRPITFPTNSSVCLDSGVVVEANPGYGPYDVMLGVSGASNVKIVGYGAKFHMATSEWSSDPDPEYRHCLAITGGSSHVTVAGFSCVTFGGDGVYLAGNSSNITVTDVTADGCARDGLTVISAKDSTIKGCHFINGHTGVDMEPNVATDALDNVTLEDSFTSNNNWGGVNVSTYAYTPASTPIKVIVARHTDEDTGKGVTQFDGATSFSANGTNGVALGGSLLFDTCTSINAGSRAAWVAWWTANGPSVTFKDLTVVNPNQNRTAADGAAIAVGRGGGGVGDQGNAFFTGTTISDTGGTIDYYFTYYDGSGFPFKDVQFLAPGSLSGASKAPPNGLLNGSGVNSVDL